MPIKPYNGEIIPLQDAPEDVSVETKPKQIKLPYTGKSLSGVQDEVADRFQAMATEYHALVGNPIRIDDAFRTAEMQAEGHRNKPKLVLPAGHSKHEIGMALDINETQAHELDELGLLSEYGFHRPMMGQGKSGKYEPWHIEPVPDFAKRAPKIAYASTAPGNGKPTPYAGEILPLDSKQTPTPYAGEILPLGETKPSTPSIFSRAADFIDKTLIQQPGSAEEASAAGVPEQPKLTRPEIAPVGGSQSVMVPDADLATMQSQPPGIIPESAIRQFKQQFPGLIQPESKLSSRNEPEQIRIAEPVRSESIWAAPPEPPSWGELATKALDLSEVYKGMAGEPALAMKPKPELSWQAGRETPAVRMPPIKQEIIKAEPEKVTPKNLAKKFATGVIGTTGSTAGGLSWLISDTSPALEKARPALNAVAKLARAFSKKNDPGDIGFVGDVASGVGSFGVFFIPGYGAATLTSKAAKILAPQVAKAFGIGIMTAGESLAEADDAYQDAISRGLSKEQADHIASRVFNMNLPLLAITERLGLFGEHGNRLRRALASGFMEDIQETFQGGIPQVAAGKPIEYKSALYQGLIALPIGMVAGAATSNIGGKPQRIDEFIDSILPKYRANAAKKEVVEAFKERNPKVMGYSDADVFERLSNDPKELSEILATAVQRTGPTIQTALRKPTEAPTPAPQPTPEPLTPGPTPAQGLVTQPVNTFQGFIIQTGGHQTAPATLAHDFLETQSAGWAFSPAGIKDLSPVSAEAQRIQKDLALVFAARHPELAGQVAPDEIYQHLTADEMAAIAQTPRGKKLLERVHTAATARMTEAQGELQAQAAQEAAQGPQVAPPVVDKTRPASGTLFTPEQLESMTQAEYEVLPPEQQKRFDRDVKTYQAEKEKKAKAKAEKKPALRKVEKGASRVKTPATTITPEPKAPVTSANIQQVADIKYSSGGDAIGQEYHGYIAAIDKKTGKVIGQVTYVYWNGDNAVKMVEVVPEYQRQGIATKLLEKLQSESEAPIKPFGDFATDSGREVWDKFVAKRDKVAPKVPVDASKTPTITPPPKAQQTAAGEVGAESRTPIEVAKAKRAENIIAGEKAKYATELSQGWKPTIYHVDDNAQRKSLQSELDRMSRTSGGLDVDISRMKELKALLAGPITKPVYRLESPDGEHLKPITKTLYDSLATIRENLTVDPAPQPKPPEAAAKEAWEISKGDYEKANPSSPDRVKQWKRLQQILKENEAKNYRPGLITTEQWRNFRDKYGEAYTVNPDLFHYFDDPAGRGVIVKPAVSKAGGQHRRAVDQALREGKPVPASVLADYPDLQVGARPAAVEKTAKAQEAPDLTAARAPGYTPTIKQAMKDWLEGRLSLDRAGKNYRLQTDKGKVVPPYNRELKQTFPDTDGFHEAAQKQFPEIVAEKEKAAKERRTLLEIKKTVAVEKTIKLDKDIQYTAEEPTEQVPSKVQKEYAIDKVQEALKNHPYMPEGWFNERKDNLKLFKDDLPEDGPEFIEFHVPGDGDFKIRNSLKALAYAEVYFKRWPTGKMVKDYLPGSAVYKDAKPLGETEQKRLIETFEDAKLKAVEAIKEIEIEPMDAAAKESEIWRKLNEIASEFNTPASVLHREAYKLLTTDDLTQLRGKAARGLEDIKKAAAEKERLTQERRTPPTKLPEIEDLDVVRPTSKEITDVAIAYLEDKLTDLSGQKSRYGIQERSKLKKQISLIKKKGSLDELPTYQESEIKDIASAVKNHRFIRSSISDVTELESKIILSRNMDRNDYSVWSVEGTPNAPISIKSNWHRMASGNTPAAAMVNYARYIQDRADYATDIAKTLPKEVVRMADYTQQLYYDMVSKSKGGDYWRSVEDALQRGNYKDVIYTAESFYKQFPEFKAPEPAPATTAGEGELLSDRVEKFRSATLGKVHDAESQTSFVMSVRPDNSSGGYSIVLKGDKGSQSFRMNYKGDMPLAEMVKDFQSYLDIDNPGRFKIELAEAKTKTQPKAGPEVSKDHPQIAEWKEQLAKYKRMKTGPAEQMVPVIERRLNADPSKWNTGDGVGWKVVGQTNRGFAISEIDPESKMALIKQVADTGLTSSGGDYDRIKPEWVPLGDLVRDNKYNVNQPAPAAKPGGAPIKPVGAVPGTPVYSQWQKDLATYNRKRLTEQGTPVKEKASPGPAVKKMLDTGKAKKLRQLADGLQKQIDARFHPASASQTPTHRRAGMVASSYAEAERLQKIQTILNRLADLHESGEVPEALSKITSKAAVEELMWSGYPKAGIHRTHLKDLLEETRSRAQGITEERRHISAMMGRHENWIPFNAVDLPALEKVAAKMPAGKYALGQIKEQIVKAKRLMSAGLETQEKWEEARKLALELASGKTAVPKEVELKRQEQELIGLKIPGFFPTPRETAAKMVGMADIQPGMDVLEPSAGNGHIADAIKEGAPEANQEVIEYNSKLSGILEAKGFNVVGKDFLESTKKYDRIVMNPPFENGQDIDHVRHAYNSLKPGGRLVSIMSEGPFYRGDKKATAFREWFDEVGGSEERLAEKTFVKEVRSTGVNGRIVVIDKPGKGGAKYTLKQARALAPTFYSQMQAHLETKLPGKGSGPQLANLIEGWATKGEFKADELKFSGLIPWLREQTGPVMRHQIIDKLKEGEVRVQVVEKGSEGRDFTEAEQKTLQDMGWKVTEANDKWLKAARRLAAFKEQVGDLLTVNSDWFAKIPALKGFDRIVDIGKAGDSNQFSVTLRNSAGKTTHSIIPDQFIEGDRDYLKIFDKAKKENTDAARKHHELETEYLSQKSLFEKSKAPQAKFQSYLTDLPESFTNRREMLLTVPTTLPQGWIVREIPNILARRIGKTDATMWEVLDGQGKQVASQDTRQSAIDLALGMKGYKVPSGHAYGDPAADVNRFAHVFTADYVDPKTGKKSLVITELQSDWAREGRKQGYKPDNAELAAAKKDRWDTLGETNIYRAELKTKYGQDWRKKYTPEEHERLGELRTKADEAERKLGELEDKTQHAIPPLPFAKNWHEVALKQAIRYAAENGYDGVMVVNGEMVKSRYDLSKHVEGIDYKKNSDDTFNIRVVARGEEALSKDNLSLRELENTVGKEIAQKMVEGNASEGQANYPDYKPLTGVDLQVGGEWANNLYDKTIPSYLRKYVKQWGAEVGKRGVSGVRDFDVKVNAENMDFYDVYENINGERQVIRGGFRTLKEAEDYLDFVKSADKNLTPLTSFPILQSMRDSVLYRGQPLYKEKPSAYQKTVDQAADNLVTGTKRGSSPAEVRAAERRLLEDVKSRGRESALANGEPAGFWDKTELDDTYSGTPEFDKIRAMGAKHNVAILPTKNLSVDGVWFPGKTPVILIDSAKGLNTHEAIAGHELFHHRQAQGDLTTFALQEMVDRKSPVFRAYKEVLAQDYKAAGLRLPTDQTIAAEIAADFVSNFKRYDVNGQIIPIVKAFENSLKARKMLFQYNRAASIQKPTGGVIRLAAKRGPPETSIPAQEHPEVAGQEEHLENLFAGAGPTPDTIKLYKKIAKGLKKNPYFKDINKDDMNWFTSYIELPFWRALENLGFKRVYNVQKIREYSRNWLNDEMLTGIEPHMKWAKSMPRAKFEKLSVALHDLVGPLGKVDPTDAQLREIGFDNTGIEGLRNIWAVFDNIADVRIPALMKEFGASQNVIDEMRSEMGRLKRFMPHYRAGKYNIMAIGGNQWETRSKKDGTPVIYKSETTAKATVTYLNNKYPSAQARAVETPDGWTLQFKPPKKVEHYEMFDDILSTLVGGERSPKITAKGKELGTRYPGSKIISTEVRRLPEEVFWRVDTKNMMAIINEVVDSAKVSDKEAVKQALVNAVVKTFQTRGFGSHFQKRKGIPGYDKTDYIRDAVQFIQSYNGFETKVKAAVAFTKALSKIDQKSQGWQYASKYIRDMLANSEAMDTLSDKMRAGFFMYFLGGVARQILLQPTQNFIAFVPAIQQYTKWSSVKISMEMARASKDVLANIGSRIVGKKPEALEGRMTPAESSGMESSRKKGILADQLTREYGTYLLSTMGRAGRALMHASMFFIGNAEKFNRHTAWLVSYRVATKELGYDHLKAVQFAEQIVEMAHFVYGKANLPPIFRGGKAAKLFRSSYAFRSYNHNLLRLYAHLGTGQTGKVRNVLTGPKTIRMDKVKTATGESTYEYKGSRSQMGVLKGLLGLLAFGGLSGLLGYKWLEEKIQARTGVNIRTEIKRNLGKLGDLVNHGLLAAAGIDLSGSLAMESPKSIGEIIGVPWALGSIPASALDFYQKGETYRTIETLAPSLVKGPMKAVRWYSEGMITRRGKSVKDATGEKVKFTPWETALKAASFRTVKEADQERRFEALQNVKKPSTEERNNLMTQYVNAYRRGNDKEINAVLKRHEEFNQKLIDLKIDFIPYLNYKSRRDARREKESKNQRRERQAFP